MANTSSLSPVSWVKRRLERYAVDSASCRGWLYERGSVGFNGDASAIFKTTRSASPEYMSRMRDANVQAQKSHGDCREVDIRFVVLGAVALGIEDTPRHSQGSQEDAAGPPLLPHAVCALVPNQTSLRPLCAPPQRSSFHKRSAHGQSTVGNRQ
jgi:hypothetical protein